MSFNDEINGFKNYLKNWRALFISGAIGIFLCFILTIFKIKIQAWVSQIIDFSPPLALFTSLLILLAISSYTSVVSVFERYRNSHFIQATALQSIDLSLIPTICLLFWISHNVHIVKLPPYIKIILISSIIFICLSYFHGTVKSIRFCNKYRKDYGAIPLLPDEPIDHEKNDRLGRVKFFKTIKAQIYELLLLQAPFTIGLYAPWGEGKTSVINLLKNEITKDNRLLVYEFNPSYLDKEETIIVNFFLGLGDLLKKNYYYPTKVKNLFKSYLQVLLKGKVGFNFNFDIKHNPIDLRKDIEQFISKLNKKILIIIDDIDRLQPLEILTIFRLVRQISHIENIIFLLSFDYNQIILALEKGKHINNAKNYIEKIIQLPLQMPLIDQNKVNNFLFSEIEKLFNRLEINSEKIAQFQEAFPTFYQSCCHQLFSNIRLVKRYLNNLIVKLPIIKDEVNLYDFFVLEILHTFSPEIYSDIKENPDIYISPWLLPEYRDFYFSDKGKRYKIIKSHIEDITLADNINFASNLLSNLFPEVRIAFSDFSISNTSRRYSNSEIENYRINQKIAHPECWKKYFMLDTLEHDISDKELFNLIKKWKNSDKQEEKISDDFFNDYKECSKLLVLLTRLKLYSKNLDKKVSLSMVNVISDNCHKFYHSKSFYMVDEYSQAINLILKLLENHIQDTEVREKIKEIFYNNKNFSFLSHFLISYRVEIESNPVGKILTFEELKEILKSRLTKHFIEEKNDVFYEYSDEIDSQRLIYFWATDWESEATQCNNQVSLYLVENFKKNPKNCIPFLKDDLRQQNGKKFFYTTQLQKAFNLTEISECIENLGEKTYSSPEEKEIIDLFLESCKINALTTK